MTDAADILDNLTKPGLTLVFCDDTEIAGTVVPEMAPDLRILCAVMLPSEAYAVVAKAMTDFLAPLGQTEFHATEVVNPTSDSSWKQVSIDDRLEAFRQVRDLLVQHSTRLYYAFVSKNEYADLKLQANKIGTVNLAHKAGLKRVFLRTLFERLNADGAKTVVVLDQDKPLAAPKLEHRPEGAFLEGGGPISASSHTVPGLQLADMAAFSIRRYLQVREAIRAGSGKPFDIMVLEGIAALEGRCEHLLNPKADAVA